MTIPIQNPEATQAAVELFDLVGSVKLALSEIISPVALIDDGWRRVTYLDIALDVPVSTAATEINLHEKDPDFSFALLYLQMRGSGNLTGTAQLGVSRPGSTASIRIVDASFLGVENPEIIDSTEILNGKVLSVMPAANWLVRHPTTGVGETFQLRAGIAQIPRGMRLL